MRYYLIVLHVLFFLQPCHASVKSFGQAQSFFLNKAKELKLAEGKQWLALLHYHQTFTGEFESQVDDTRFFVSNNGKTNPSLELEENIRAFINSKTSRKYQCQFPARFYWLSRKLEFEKHGVFAQDCKEFKKWFYDIKPKTVSLIFPAAFLNGPSSMFGHTLLRLNPSDHRENTPLAAYALNYAADSEQDDNSLQYVYKGIFGGYPGKFDIVPYYAKIKEYGDIENRDIWEFELNLTQEEVDLLMRHTWEVKDIVFDYYFFTENCSYRLLTLLNAVRPGTSITNGFENKAIPADTVKAARRAGFVGQHHYRPSKISRLISRQGQVNEEQLAIAKDISKGVIDVNNKEILFMLDREKARIYELAYDLTRIRSIDEYDKDKRIAKISYRLLKARSLLDVRDIWSEVKEPDARDDEGHGTSRVAVSVTDIDSSKYLSIYYRPAFHDVLDPLQGYRAGSQINFFDFHFRYDIDTKKIALQQFKIIDILSSTPRSELIKPISWSFGLGTEKREIMAGEENVFYSEFSAGLSYQPLSKQIMTVSLVAELDLNHKMIDGYSAGSGYQFSWLMNADNGAARLQYKKLDFNGGETYHLEELKVQSSIYANLRHAFRLEMTARELFSTRSNKVEISWHHYF